jgi:hypothetical protein
VDGIQILDSGRPVNFYRGRWRQPSTKDTGQFVARRPQAYGSDLWCYVELKDGEPQHLIDLPLSADSMRGCDEAWRLQAAIDAARHQPQSFRLEHSGSAHVLLSLFGPPPSWLQRRWDGCGKPVSSRSALVTYLLPASNLAVELDFLRRMLWLEETPND